MKYIPLFFLISFMISGCATQPQGIENRLSIQFRDSTIHDYTLIYLRDTALLVASPSEYYHDPASVQVIPFSRIAHVYRFGVRNDGNAFWGFIVGGLAGFALGSTSQHSDALPITLPLGILVGTSLFRTSDIGDETYDLSRSIDRTVLKYFARYPFEEPPTLRTVK